MAKVSLIMLVYNTGQFIEKSLRSALEQTFEDMEIVIVNDATPDNAMTVVENVLKEYPNRAGQVRIISHPVNMGSAVARQTGIDNATGEYTIYLDSDDWVEPEMVERLYRFALENDADIVVCDYYAEFPKRQIYHSQPAPPTGKECARALIRGSLHGSTWNKLIRRNLYSIYNVKFIPDINLWEDLIATIKLCWHADKVNYLPKAFLHYFQGNTQALTHVVNQKWISDRFRAMEEIECFIKEKQEYADFVEDINYRKLFIQEGLIRNTRGNEQKKMAGLYPDIPLRYILKNKSLSLPYRIAHYLASFGLFWPANIIYGLVYLLKKVLR